MLDQALGKLSILTRRPSSVAGRCHGSITAPAHAGLARHRAEPGAEYSYLRIIDRGAILDAARTALGLHQWLVEPDFDQEGEVPRAEAVLAAQANALPLLLAAAKGFRDYRSTAEKKGQRSARS